MDARMLKNKYCLEVEDLPLQQGTIVQIIGVDSEEREGNDGKPYWQHVLNLNGWKVGLRLNNTHLDTIMAIYGTETDNWIGKKLKLVAQVGSKFGKTAMVLGIEPAPVFEGLAITPPPQYLTPPQQQLPSFGQSAQHGFGLPQHRGAGQLPPGQQQPPGVDFSQLQLTIGAEKAEGVMIAAARRGKTFADLKAHIFRTMPHLAEHCAGKGLADFPLAAGGAIRPFLEGFAPTREPPADMPKLRAEWGPPLIAAQQAPPPDPLRGLGASELVNTTTGEVIKQDPVTGTPSPNDDIPF